MSATLNETMPPPVRLPGFDTQGEVFLSGDRLLRGIYAGHAAGVRDVLATCVQHDLFSLGIVRTSELSPNPYPELEYEMVLEHERIPFVTYPHEWSASMFKEAALFHVGLFERLHEFGLTLKDWHPYNILFDATRPVFVDFTSIIRIGHLPVEPHLNIHRPDRFFDRFWDPAATAFYEMYSTMFEPFTGLPLVMMHRGRHAEVRKRLAESALNTSPTVISHAEAFAGNPLARARHEVEDRLLRIDLTEKGTGKKKFFNSVKNRIASRNAAVTGSAYSTYYEDKGEAFSREPQAGWTSKQHVVNDAIARFRPRTLLDLGSNTGWFSMLAASHGCTVVAVDVDEASIDRLFATAERDRLSVLPLVVNLAAPQVERHALDFEDEPSLSLLGGDDPVIRGALDRLQCEMTLALAIVHHLALGQGLTFERIAGLFDALATKHVCVEFVDIGDRMITSEPDFFPAYAAARDSFGWYTRDNFVTALRAHFASVDELPSYPETRTMLVCSR